MLSDICLTGVKSLVRVPPYIKCTKNCIHFKGREVTSPTPAAYLNGTQLKWQNTVKHLGSYISHNLKEEEEIKSKRRTLAVAVNGLFSNFGTLERIVIAHIFNRQCSYFYGCET